MRDLPCKFTRQKPLGTYVADFYCSEKQLVIELDGDSHYTEAGERYDRARTATLGLEGIRVMRFTNPEVMQQFEAVCAEIEEALKSPGPSGHQNPPAFGHPPCQGGKGKT